MSSEIKIGIIGGTGLNDPDILQNRQEKKVTTIFGDPSDTLLVGTIHGVQCVLLPRHGRQHSVMPGRINFRANIWALKEEGCTHILATTATGSLREEIKPGDLVLLDSFIDRTQGRQQSFYDGEPDHPQGISHLPMEPNTFCNVTRQIITDTACELDIQIHPKGTVVAIEGPRFSSKAESNMYRLWGGDVINMTTVPEVCLAKEAGICYAQIALATDYDCWRDTGEKVTHTQVMKTFANNVEKLKTLLVAVVQKIGSQDWTDRIKEARQFAADSVYLPLK